MVMSLIRLNHMSPAAADGQVMSERYRAAIEMVVWADRNGFDIVSTEEHHVSDLGWSPTPLMTAGMILSQTEKVMVTISALLVPLHDPVRLAEDIAVLDLVSRGRISIVTGIGYRPVEYAALDKEWTRRGQLLDEALDVMMQAWTGEPFEYRGETIRVLPAPFTQPHPIVLIGGSSPAAARRAARLGLPLQLPGPKPEVEALYHAECERLGTTPFAIVPDGTVMLHVAEDPDRVWAEHGQCFMNEAMTYQAWQPPGQTSAVSSHASTVEELRAEGIYQVLTPDEAIALGRDRGVLSLHPLVGGMPIDEAWASVELTADKVLPALAD